MTVAIADRKLLSAMKRNSDLFLGAGSDPAPTTATNENDSAPTPPPARKRMARTANLVLKCIKEARDGLTCDEVEVATGLPHQSASPRIYDLRNRGHVRASKLRRATRRGRKATVWVA